MSSIQSLLDQFLGGDARADAGQNAAAPQGNGADLKSKMPGGLMGGAAAGGIVALLLGNKKARKFAGKAAGYGGAAVVGGLAYRALQTWQRAPSDDQQSAPITATLAPAQVQVLPATDEALEIKMITAMIAAAKADGHIDSEEQERIFSTMEEMDLAPQVKGVVFDLLRKPIVVADIARGVASLEHKAEIYMAASLAIDEDHPGERAFLDELAMGLNLPDSLAAQIRSQAQQDVQHQAGYQNVAG